MKGSIVLCMLAMATAAIAQQEQAPQAKAREVKLTNLGSVQQQAPTYSDVYCAGYISKQPLQKSGFVAGGRETPHQTRFVERDYVYLEGSGFAVGTPYWLVRRVRDPNRYEAFRGQHGIVRQLGQPYTDVGRVRVVGIHDHIAIAQVEFNCGDILPGDAAIPFAERQIPALRTKTSFDPFAPPNGKLTGKIVMGEEFETQVGMGQKVYLNVGANQGVKVGDYFRAVRSYDSYRNDPVDNLSFKASYYDDTQIPEGRFPYSRLHEFPRMSLGEMIVLSVTPTSSTAMITMSLEGFRLGDGVELEEVPTQAGTAEPITSPLEEQVQTPAAAQQPPVIACTAAPPSVRAGESSTITCEASSPDNRPLAFSFSAPNAPLVQRDNTAILDTRDVAPGTVEVLAAVSDDRNLSATANTAVNVEAPRPALLPSKLNFVSFKPNSARVDNAGKAVLDGVALRLQRESDSSLVVLGLVESGENAGLARQRAANTAQYLTKEKGIDEKRLQLRDGGEYGNKAELWMVPPGTKLQEADLKH